MLQHVLVLALQACAVRAAHELGTTTTVHRFEDDLVRYEDYADSLFNYGSLDKLKTGTGGECASSTSEVSRMKVCDLNVRGFDMEVDGLTGGLDGYYFFQGCKHGKPYYTRSPYTSVLTRTLWYSNIFWDWNLSEGKNVTDASVLAFGGAGALHHHSQPQDATGAWFINSSIVHSTSYNDVFERAPQINITCINGTWQEIDTYPAVQFNYSATLWTYQPEPVATPASSGHMVALIAAAAVGVVATLSGLAACGMLVASWRKRRYIKKALRAPLAKAAKEPPVSDKDLEAEMDMLLQTSTSGWMSGQMIKARHTSCLNGANCLSGVTVVGMGNCFKGQQDEGENSDEEGPRGPGADPYRGPSEQEVQAMGYSTLRTL